MIDSKTFFFSTEYELIEFVPFFNSYRIECLTPIVKKVIPFDGLANQRSFERKISQNICYIIADTLEIKL